MRESGAQVMGLCTFKGGVHPYDGKELSKDKPIRDYLPKGDLVYPLSQHIGAPAKPVVAVGDEVLKGQMIAEAGGFVSAPIYASASGKIKAIEPRRTVVGDMVNAIILENDGEFKEVEYQAVDDVSALSKEEIMKRIQDAGVVGMGGAGFPTHVKLSPKEPEKIDYIIANCAECEPYLTADYRRMVEEPEKLIEGMRIILSMFDNAKGIFGVEDNKPDCIAKLRELVKDEPRMEVKALKTKYPQGSERQLIYAATGRAINSTMLPADAGCIVDNVDTIVAIYHAVKFGMPLMQRIVTITGDAVTEPQNLRCEYRYKLCRTSGSSRRIQELSRRRVIAGGPMMGFAMFDLNCPTTKTTGGLLLLAKDDVEEAEAQETACINCGRCVAACPSRMVPSRLADFAEQHRPEMFEAWHGMECMECGSCSYTCPAKRNLAQAIKSMRKTILANRRKK
ncbi:electron transport complex subunit RsxC [Eubacterium ramulus]|uniref:electron transport complex subunit RsxC n=1 Tax=Eubacterium ramulus TaxID=39490 RepID=UPI00351FA314